MIAYMLLIDSPEDRSKFQKLYMKYRNLMYYVAYEILHNHHDAEDAVHQAFVRIAENIEEIETPICPKTRSYVVTIVENKAIDMYRHKQRHPLVEYNDETVGIVIEYDGTNTLGECMSRLPARYRELIILKYVHGYTFKETARIMGITEDNAKKMALRAKEKLAAMCKEEGLL